MIYYSSSSTTSLLCNVFRCRGSVFGRAFVVAAPCATIAVVLCYAFPASSMPGFVLEAQVWGGFSMLVGFLVVFRTSQAYGRFWEGCTASYRMRTEWINAISSLFAFLKHSDANPDEVRKFKEVVVRLTSMLHASALAELEAGEQTTPGELWAHSYQIIDPTGMNSESIEILKNSAMRTELIFQWLQDFIVEHVKNGVLTAPAPLLSRSFQELANGMVAYHDALRISHIPFPFPYGQACDCTLLFHWLLAPCVTSQWVTNALWAGLFTLIPVFIFWSLNMIATEIDHPFGRDSNDVDSDRMQRELNRHLLLMISVDMRAGPRLSKHWNVEAYCLDHFAHVTTTNSTLEPRTPTTMGELLRRPATLGELLSFNRAFTSDPDSSWKEITSHITSTIANGSTSPSKGVRALISDPDSSWKEITSSLTSTIAQSPRRNVATSDSRGVMPELSISTLLRADLEKNASYDLEEGRAVDGPPPKVISTIDLEEGGANYSLSPEACETCTNHYCHDCLAKQPASSARIRCII